MLDIKLIRTNPELVKKALERRHSSIDIEPLLELDKNRREIIFEVETLKANQNEVSKQIPQLKKEGKDTSQVFADMKEISNKIKELDTQVSDIDAKIQQFVLSIPNIPNEKVPDGADDSANIELRKHGEPRNFEFEPKAHWDLGENLNILDFSTAAKISGARFTVYRGAGARLERAIINLTHTLL